ncbi:MAG: hypothetical protein RMX96_33170 [Nostoc sp. ChiSLP02]|nr:hypothetical protein [Nostoc sp. DedSLP05]MDZ8103567.1 hypothetical protein [Nostoc sp. DedSLP01]MDZ8189676.1 hypothetical protein [Nostoc sp. ChiSLP02]
MLNNEEQQTNLNTCIEIDSCISPSLPTEPIHELPTNSTVSFMIATAILLRAVTGLIQVLIPAIREKAGKN